MRSRSRTALAGVFALLAMTLLVPTIAASGVSSTHTRWVDDDGKAGPTSCGGSRTAAKSIQSAVNRSDRNDVVIVCPGTYRGTVGITGSVRAGMTLRAYSKGTAVIKASASMNDGPVMWVERVSGVTVQGLAFEFPSTGCDTSISRDIQGLWAEDADGLRVSGNRIRTTGSATLGPCGYDTGIQVVSSTSVRVANNTVRDFKRFGISFLNGARGTIEANAVQFYHTAADTNDDGDQGIRVVDGSRAEVSGNTVRSASGSGEPRLELGIVVKDASGVSDVHDNLLQYVKTGLGLIRSTGRVAHNDVSGVGVQAGIFIDSGSGSEVVSNRIRNFDIGLEVDTAGTTLRANDSRNNSTQGCLDTTVGSGTLGTANVWSTSNIGAPASAPDGICRLP